MEALGLFLIALLVVVFPKQSLKAIGLCFGVCAGIGVLLGALALGFYVYSNWQTNQHLAREEAETLAAAHGVTLSFEKRCQEKSRFPYFSQLTEEELGSIKDGYRELGHPELAEVVDQIVEEGIKREKDAEVAALAEPERELAKLYREIDELKGPLCFRHLGH
jgi:hypothetical protein